MKYNLTDCFENIGKIVEEDITLELDAVSMAGEEYELKDASKVHMTATNIERGKANVNCAFSCFVELPCDRCLKPVRIDISVDSETVVFAPDYTGDTTDASEFMDGYKFDVEELILSELCLNWPTKVLCKEDCKGICSVCGKDLNEGDCGCDRFVPNAAFAGLSDLFKFD